MSGGGEGQGRGVGGDMWGEWGMRGGGGEVGKVGGRREIKPVYPLPHVYFPTQRTLLSAMVLMEDLSMGTNSAFTVRTSFPSPT